EPADTVPQRHAGHAAGRGRAGRAPAPGHLAPGARAGRLLRRRPAAEPGAYAGGHRAAGPDPDRDDRPGALRLARPGLWGEPELGRCGGAVRLAVLASPPPDAAAIEPACRRG